MDWTSFEEVVDKMEVEDVEQAEMQDFQAVVVRLVDSVESEE